MSSSQLKTLSNNFNTLLTEYKNTYNDYINNIDESEIAEAIILRETDREGKEKPNPQMQGLD